MSANGKHFTAGLDLTDAIKFGQELAEFEDVARKANFMEQKIKAYQVIINISLSQYILVDFETNNFPLFWVENTL